nr:hypothetical protein F08E10.4 - Caenorhabditis elegans [Caenorhabditis elegans]
MKPMQLPLFLNHLFGGLLDVCFCSFSTLFFFEPMMAFATVGVFNWLGVPFVYQGVFGAAMASGVAGSYVFLFESRSSSLIGNRFRIHKQSSSFLYYTYFFAPYIAVLVAIANVAEESDAAKLRALEVYPCPTPEFLCSQSAYSWETQTSIPLFVIIAPAMAVLLASWTGTYRQEWMNLSNICIATHGLAESIAIVLVHKPYRAAIKKILRKGNTIANHRSVELY